MFNKVINSIKDGTFFDKVFNKIKIFYYGIYRNHYNKSEELNPKKIMFITFQGDYNCNPKAIANEFIKSKSDFELVWVVRKENLIDTSQYPKELKLVVRNTKEFYKEAASSKYIVDNANNFEYLKMQKREGQVLLQPWHGSMGFKKLDPSSVKNENWVRKALKLDEITDYCIVNSKFEEDVFKGSYWPTTEMLHFGHPRNDVLFNKNGEFEKYSKIIRKKYGIKNNVKLALYAPTFRDDCSLESYNLDYEKLHEALVERFGGEWRILVRFHFKLKNMPIPKKYLEKVVNVTDYPDMQELLCGVDFGITDYSSWMCDFVLTNKPGFLYTSDIEKYIDERGFYYPLESSPFPVAKTNEELCNKIISFDEKKYKKDVKEFLKDKGCCEEGAASKKVIEFILKLNKEVNYED